MNKIGMTTGDIAALLGDRPESRREYVLVLTSPSSDPLHSDNVKRLVEDAIHKPKHNWANYKNEHFKGHKKPGTKWKKRKQK